MNTYTELLKNPHWLLKRQSILSRDKKQCKNCGAENHLQIHHRQYHIDHQTGKFLPPWQYHEKYLITLCSTCHKKGHTIYKVPNFTIKTNI